MESTLLTIIFLCEYAENGDGNEGFTAVFFKSLASTNVSSLNSMCQLLTGTEELLTAIRLVRCGVYR